MTGTYDSELAPTDLSIGDTGPTMVVADIERRDFVRYAGASGDFNQIHYNDLYARKAGNAQVFGQGMLTAGFVSHLAADWFGIANIDRFRVRFRSKVWPGDTLVVSGKVTDLDSLEDSVRVDAILRVENQDDDPIVTGDVTATITK